MTAHTPVFLTTATAMHKHPLDRDGDTWLSCLFFAILFYGFLFIV